MLLAPDDELQESFFESHVGPFGQVDVPYQETLRRGEGVIPEYRPSLMARSGSSSSGVNFQDSPSSADARPSTAPARPALKRVNTFNSYDTQGTQDVVALLDAAAADAAQSASQTPVRPSTGGTGRNALPYKFTFASAAENRSSAGEDLAVTAPLVHSVRKGLQHDHDYDDSNLLSNQVEPPFHNITMRVACRVPADVSLHFKRSTAAIAEEIDEAVEREEVDEMFRKSLEIFHKIGYVTKRPLPHATHWVKVVSLYLATLRSIDDLRKGLATLHRTSPQALTVEEAVCVLSDVKGVVGQAVEKLKHREYYAEIRLVCRSIQIKNMVLLLEGGDQIYHYKVGDSSRAPSAPRSRLHSTGTYGDMLGDPSQEWPLGRTPGGSMFVGMDEDALRAATLVSDPYSTAMVEQHREVVAHRKIRQHWDEVTGSQKQTSPTQQLQQLQQQQLPAASAEGVAAKGLAAKLTRLSTFAARNEASEVAEDMQSTEQAANDIASIGLFTPSQRPKLRQDSRFVRSRASLITLQSNSQGDAAVPGVSFSQESQTSESAGSNGVPTAGRSALRMSVTSPKKSVVNISQHNRGSVLQAKISMAGSVGGNRNISLLGAIAAAVAAADEADGSAPVTAATNDREDALTNLRASLHINTTSKPNTRSSIRNSTKLWRKNSGIFDAVTPKPSTPSTPLALSSRLTPKQMSARQGSARQTKPEPSPPKWSVRSNGGHFFLEEDTTPNPPAVIHDGYHGDSTSRSGADNALVHSLVEGDEDEGDDEVVDGEEGEEEEPVVASPPAPAPMRPQVSINPWYLKNQQSQSKQFNTSPSPPRSPAHNTPAPQSPSRARMLSSRDKSISYRTENIVTGIFEKEALGVPFAVMSRRDAERATKDETLAKSDKQYIRRTIELRALNYQHTN
jgi:hypothetical protein